MEFIYQSRAVGLKSSKLLRVKVRETNFVYIVFQAILKINCFSRSLSILSWLGKAEKRSKPILFEFLFCRNIERLTVSFAIIAFYLELF